MADAMFSDLGLVKEHLRVDHDAEDSLIQSYILAAEQSVRGLVQRPIYAPGEALPEPEDIAYSRYQMHANEAMQIAVMLMVARLYDDRHGENAEGPDAVPPLPVRMLLAPYRVWHREIEDETV